MIENFDFVTDVNARKLDWNFKVYIVRIWEVPSKYNKKEIGSIEMILQDCKGGRIYATIPRALAEKWSGNIIEFEMYTMTNFIVFDNKTISKNGVSRMEDPRDLITSRGLMTKRMVVILEDLENNKMSCTLFGQLVDHILPHLDDGRVETLIVVLQYFKATRWNGKTSVQSNFDISKVHINPTLKEIDSFRCRLLSGGPSSSTRISQVSSPAAWSANDEFNRGSVSVKTIKDALNSVEVLCFSYFNGTFSKTVETIYFSVKRKNDWFYKACRRCPKKVETPIGDRYECGKCGHTHGAAAIRYKVEVMVYDGSGSINLLLWDRETTQLCGKQVDKIVLEDAVGDDDYPPSLNNMMDKKVLFKINVKSSNIKQYDPVYTVMKICDDEDIILKNLPTIMPSNQSAHVHEADCSNSIDVSSNDVAIISDNDPELTLDSMEECISSLKFKTSAKRAVGGSKPGLINVNNLEDEGHLSTNKFNRKGAKKLRSQLNDGNN
ncbi:Replication protein A 70 kDa DNA-binding subunit A [Arachis hypogaea]|nr:Replication protein A 70 kDa DNA-binding subunit A [Arachis hypogaea]